MSKLTFSPSVYRERRARLSRLMNQAHPKSALVLLSAPVCIRNGDVEHEYRQNSDFYWLTGFEEPGAALVLTAQGELSMFVRPRDPAREIWDGPRAGVIGVKRLYGAKHAWPITELGEQLPQLLLDRARLYHGFGQQAFADASVTRALQQLRQRRAREPVALPTELFDPGLLLHEARLRKDPHELDLMREAVAITGRAHRLAMREAREGLTEAQVEGLMHQVFAEGQAARAAYGSIVGSGPNATILHHRSGRRVLREGELLLIDAGCEYGYYASDITRTFPVSGRFSPAQRALYQAVLDAQLAAIEMVAPGVTLDAIHERVVEVLIEGMLKLKLLKGKASTLKEKKHYQRYYMHRTSHWLGLDVHDVGTYMHECAPRRLEPGMVLTIEPGLYVGAKDTKAPPRLRGLGVRIEDDILVTERGYENLSAAIPKSIEEVEQACRGR